LNPLFLKNVLQTRNMPELVKMIDENVEKDIIQQAYLEKMLKRDAQYQLLQKHTSTMNETMATTLKDSILQRYRFDPVYRMLGNSEAIVDCGCGNTNQEGESDNV